MVYFTADPHFGHDNIIKGCNRPYDNVQEMNFDMIHGHIHNDTNSDYWHLLRSNPRILNAGVDINNFEPVTLEELIRNNEEFKRKHIW